MHKGMISQQEQSPQRSNSHTPRQSEQKHSRRWSGVALRTSILTTLLASLCIFSLLGTTMPTAYALANGQGLTPVMGWSSWNAHFANINAAVIEAAANAIVSSGMQAAGYQYVNIDEGWWSGTRDSNGNITVDQTKWPGGMQAVASYIHSKGLKAGIYTDAGANGCGGTNQGSYGHYDQDMLQFEQWGFDYVKVDWCGGVALGLTPATQYAQIRDSIAKATAQTGHPMGFSICEWGVADPWNWGPGTGNSWRTSNDISFTQGSVAWSNILKNFDAATLHPDAQSLESYNDPDMMEVGASGISTTESQAHFSLWAISGAPLLAGNDITTMSSTTQSILTNSEVIAVDQDPLDLQAVKVSEPSIGLQVWSKVLSGSGQRAVALLNRTGSTANIKVNWNDIDLTGSAAVRDLWAHSNLGNFSGSYTASVPSHGVVLLKISGTEPGVANYEAESSSNTLSGGAVVQSCASCSGGKDVGHIGNGGILQFNNVQTKLPGPQVVTVYYVNADTSARTATVSVNGRPGVAVVFPSTGGSWSSPVVGSIKITGYLTGHNNTIQFSNSSAWAPDVDRVTAQPGGTSSVYGNFTTYEAESSSNTLAGGAIVQSCSACSGGKNVGYVGNGGTLRINNVNVSSAGTHRLVISYIDGDTSTFGIGTYRTANISINGGSSFAVSFPSTGDWNEVVTTNISVTLNAGNNTITFSNSSAYTPNFDKIDVV
jgi:alpha-galactosidase